MCTSSVICHYVTHFKSLVKLSLSLPPTGVSLALFAKLVNLAFGRRQTCTTRKYIARSNTSKKILEGRKCV